MLDTPTHYIKKREYHSLFIFFKMRKIGIFVKECVSVVTLRC